ncbi:MAG: S41 family peptidase [Saprospiraceae bacterium]
MISLPRNTLFVLLSFFCFTLFAQSPGYYRQPTLHDQTVVFSSEGDLWVIPLSGGEARRLTSHAGEEVWPVLSPDGKTVAFTAEYQGSADLYVMPVRGGAPKRVSHIGARPVAWTPDGEIVARTRSRSGLPQWRLVKIRPADQRITEIELAEAAEAAYTADGTIIFARLPRQGSNSRWYKGGTAPKLWSFNAGDAEAKPLTTDYPGSSRQPTVLTDGRLYFLSDRQDAMNVWSMMPDGTDLKRHTEYLDLDIQELTGHGQQLVYRMGADLYRLDVTGGQPEMITVSLRSDSEQSLIEYETEPLKKLSDAAISHKGDAVALVSRGELFVAPKRSGRLVHLDANSGVRYREVAFGKDSSIVYALSDASGELEWWRIPVDGTAPATKITTGPAMLRQGGLTSPDGKLLAQSDYEDNTWIVNLSTGTSTKIDDKTGWTKAWSPDSRYLVYSKSNSDTRASLFVYDTKSEQSTQITSDAFNDSRPAFSEKGDWLFFVSSRHWNSDVNSPWGERAPMPHFSKTEGIFALPLRENKRYPFTPDNELLAKAKKDTSKATDPMRFDLLNQLRELPMEPSDYGNFLVGKTRLFFVQKNELFGLDMKPDAEPVSITSDVSEVSLSGDQSSLLVRKNQKGGGGLYILGADAGKETDLKKAGLELGNWRFAVNKRAEWNQIYMDMWRLHRDYFWDPNMHGVDWTAMRKKYEPLLPRVGSRNELNDLQGQLVSELSLLHSNARGGDVRQPDPNIEVGQLGAVFVKEAAGFRVAKRFEGHPDQPNTWSPLQHPDVRVEEGDLIIAINGRKATDIPQLEAMLIDQIDKHILLEVRNAKGVERSVLAKAISPRENYMLRYEDWERERVTKVDKLSMGELGYLHVQVMGKNDIGRFTRDFYSQLGKKGMIIDVRHNFGGNIDSWILTALMRKAWSYFTPRSNDESFPNMQESFNGPLVVLTDHWTASDGEAFADGFTRLGLGQTIGTRTWGGEVWLSSGNRQVDGGIARASELGVYGNDRKWLIEGWGFVPAQEVDNLPHATYKGSDAQLEAAVKYLQIELKKNPVVKPAPPAYPVVKPGVGFPTPYAGWKG